MGYELRVERQSPPVHAELTGAALADAGFGLRGSQEAGEIVARHGDMVFAVAVWNGGLTGRPTSDWHVAQLARLAGLLGGRVVGEDGEVYGIRNGVVEQVSGASTYEFGKLDEILAAGPADWSQ
jgi:hypothetical protein